MQLDHPGRIEVAVALGTKVETVTVLFTDLAESTALRVRLGEEEADRVRHRHDTTVFGAITDHRGRIVKHTGDGVMATFQGASDAVAAGVAIQQALDVENRAHPDQELLVRVGISVGDVSSEGDDCFGLPVVEAQRLEAAARPGQILCSSIVPALARGRGGHEFDPVGALTLKGLDEPVDAQQVRWDPLAAASATELPPVLVHRSVFEFAGRAKEREKILDHWRAVQGGATKVVLLAGEPGVGKTRLATEFARDVQVDGGLVIAGRCDELVGAPYQPFGEALAAQLRVPGGVLTLGPLVGELVRLFADLDSFVPNLPPPLDADADAERTKLFDAVCGWLTATAEHQPVLLVLDDLHWADQGTLLLMRHVAVNHPIANLLVLGTYRDTDVDRRHALSTMLAELRRRGEVERIGLEGLDTEELIELMTSAAGHQMEDDGLTLARSLHDETAGNPFFVGEVLRHLAETGAITQRDGTWVAGRDDLVLPEGVRDVVGRRLSALPEETQRVLEIGAVVGPRFDLDVVAHVGGFDEDDVLDFLDAAITAHLVEETGVGRYRFSHALVRSTLHQELSSTRRSRLHRKTAEALEKVHTDDNLARAGELAYHWSEASSAGEVVKAVDAARHAAELAIRAAAPLEAARWYEHALEMVDEDNVRERIDLMILALDARMLGGEAEAVSQSLEAARLAEAIDDLDLMVRALDISIRTNLSGGEKADPERIALLERAIVMAGDASAETQAVLYGELAIELIYTGDEARRAELAHMLDGVLLQIADPVERYRSAVRAAHGRPWSMNSSARARATVQSDEHALVLEHDDPRVRCDALNNEWYQNLLLGNRDRAFGALAVMTEQAVLTRHPFIEDMIPLLAFQADLIDGKLDECWQQTQLLEDRWKRHSWPSFEVYTASANFQVARERGLLAFLTEAQLAPEDNDIPGVRTALAALAYVESGDTGSALQLMEQRAGKDFDDVPDDAAIPIARSMWSEVAARVRHRHASQIWYDKLVVDPELHFGTGGWYLGSTTRNLGMLASTLGRDQEATAWFERALTEHERMQSPPWIARTLLDWAEHDLANGRTDNARARIEHAVAVIGALPLTASLSRAEKLTTRAANTASGS